eukprot:TCONS_00021757-protein
MESVEVFLTRLKLEQYIENLHVNGIFHVNEITEQVLSKCGIEKIGHQKRILTELAKLNFSDSPEMNHSTIAETNDAPALPPKRSATATSRTIHKTPPTPPRRSVSTRPVRPPPRTSASVARGGSLPKGAKLNNENYFVINAAPAPPINTNINNTEVTNPTLPPQIPPRIDIGEAQQIENNNNGLSPKRRAPPPPTPNHRNEKGEPTTGILIEVDPPESPIASPPLSPPVPAPRTRAKVLPTVQFEEVVAKTEPDTTHSEDEASDDDIFPPEDDDDSPSESESKVLTISMRENTKTFERLLSENTIPRTESEKRDNRKSRFLTSGKKGYLHKKGGQDGKKPPQKRWVEFDGIELKYFKEKGDDPRQIIPVSRMMDVQAQPDAKKPTFHLLTPNRKFTFFDNNGDLNETSVWMQCLMEAILNKPDVPCLVGGQMSDPDMEGWLLKQGHGVLVQDFKRRYVAIKDDKLCYYNSFSHFEEDLPIFKLQMSLASLKEDVSRRRLLLSYHTQRTYVFEVPPKDSYEQWKDAIEGSIEKALGDDSVLQILMKDESNLRCADCGTTKNVNWASIKCLVIICKRCCGRHRGYSQKFFLPRSILMDVKIWTNELIEIFKLMGNKNANMLWAAKLPPDEQISPDCSTEERITFLKDKYIHKKYFKLSEHFGLEHELGEALRKAVVTEDLIQTFRLIQSGASVMYIPEESEDKRTPYQLAEDAGQSLQVALLEIYKGNLSIEEWEKEQQEEAARIEEQLRRLPQIQDDNTVYYEKAGELMMKMHEKENWRDARMFQLKEKIIHRSIRTEEGKPRTEEVIDLRQMEEIKALDDQVTFFLQTSSNHSARTYYFKAFTPEDCRSWFTAIKNKQVFEVALDKQEVSADKIPYLVDKCIKYMETNALTDMKTLTQEGIYRKNGSQAQIRDLTKLFNQDAANVRLDISEYYDVHVICGLLKKYLRDLPEPLVTNILYESFLQNTYEGEIEHNERLYRYRDLIKGLPAINLLCLRALILHLHLVVELSSFNLMTMENVSLLFGPIICSCGRTLNQDKLRLEYKVLQDLLTYYKWLFDVDENETKSQEAILKFTKSAAESTVTPTINEGGMQITIYLKNIEDRMLVDSSTRPSDVCAFFIKTHDLDRATNWALFESINDGTFERPLSSKESVYDLALSLSDNGKLIVKENYLLEKLAPHQSASFNSGGVIHFLRDKSSWKKVYLEIKQGMLRVASSKDSSKDIDKFGIVDAQVLLYSGIDPKKKGPANNKFGFMIKVNGSISNTQPRYFCSDQEEIINMFMAVILNLRYPVGIWTDRCSKDFRETEAESNRNSQFWGRQSMVIQQEGAAHRFTEQLQSKRSTLRRLFRT